MINLEELYRFRLQRLRGQTGQRTRDALFRVQQQWMSPQHAAGIAIGLHQSLHQLLVLCASARPAAGHHRQMVQPVVLVLFVRHQQIRRSLMRRKDTDRSLVRTLGVPLLAVAVRHVLHLLHSSVPHVNLANGILGKKSVVSPDAVQARSACLKHISRNDEMIACAHRVARALEVKEHLADENAPALLRVAVLHLRQPTLYRRLVVLLAEQ